MLFLTRCTQLNIPVGINSDIYYISIHVNRLKQEHIDKINLFIKMLDESNIEWKTFISTQPSMNVCVEMKYKKELEQIYKEVYGYEN